MKKLLLFFITLVLSVSIYAQTSPVGLSRIASATTAFGSPLPFGWKVFDGNTKLTYTVIEATGVAGTATLTSASSSFQLDTPDLSVYELLSNKQSNLTASTTKYPTVNAVNTGLGTKQDALGFTPYNATNPSSYIPLTALSSTATGLTYANTTGVFSLTSGYAIPTTTNISTWNSLVSASGYLPLSAGSGQTLTGDLYIGATQNINFAGSLNGIYLSRYGLGPRSSFDSDNSNNIRIGNSTDWNTIQLLRPTVMYSNNMTYGDPLGDGVGEYFTGTDLRWFKYPGGTTLMLLNQSTGAATFSSSVTATGATFTTGAGSGKVWTSDGSGVGSWAALGGAAYKGQIDGSTGSGLADGTGTTGWYYACSTAGTHNYGSGNITLAIGDQLYYNGSIWLKMPGAGSYTLPTASSSVLGGVKSGSVVTVDGSGVLGFSNPGYISGNQTITLGGILSGSGTTSISASAASGYYMPTTTDQTNWNAKTSYNDLPYPQKFTEAATGSTGQVNTLDHTPKGGKVLSVAQNGSILDPAKYTVSGATVQVTSPVYANDQITVSFIY